MPKLIDYYLTLLICFFATACATCSSQETSTGLSPINNAIPQRHDYMLTGSKFIKTTYNLNEQQRERAAYNQIISGNFPQFMRKLVPIKIDFNANGRENELTIWVTRDYLSIGSEKDFIRMPMNPLTAQKIANKFGSILPTAKIVDIIYRNATVKLSPSPQKPGPQMTQSWYYLQHNSMIQKQLGYKIPSGLIAGHKKDVVITNRLFSRKGRVAIYGWHRKNYKAIQPLSLVHHEKYADYSHGIRLVRNKVVFNGKVVPILSILNSRSLAHALSYEGPMKKIQYEFPFRYLAAKTFNVFSH